jgi:hypothetical protein
MKKSRPATASRLYTPRATSAAIGLKIRSLKLFETIAEHVHIRQKTIKHTPIEKYDGCVCGDPLRRAWSVRGQHEVEM